MSNIKYEVGETIIIKFGRNNFIEVSMKVAVIGQRTFDFVSVARGFFKPDGKTKKYTKAISIPTEAKIRKQIADAILNIL